MEPLLAVENLQISCLGRPIVKQASFTIPKGSVTAIVGPSGVGKTTLLRSINRLLDEDRTFKVDGTLSLHQQQLYGKHSNKYELRRRIGLVFQKPTIFPTTIFKNVIFGIRHTAPLRRKAYAALAERCLRQAFLWEEVKDRLQAPALQLSIGQQQRLAIARALATGPEILLMDEPTSSLDPHAASQIENLILSLKATTSVIFVTHNVQQAIKISDQVVAMRPSDLGSITEFIVDRIELSEGRWLH